MKNFIYYFTLILTSAFVFNSCKFTTQGEGEITSKEVKLNNIRQLSAKGNYRLIYLYDNQNPRIVIETHQNLIDNLKINTAGGQLSLSESRDVKDTEIYNIYLYNPEIERFDIYNTVNVEINSQLRVSALTINMEDTSKLLASNIIVDQLNVKANNTSKINLKGTGSKLDLMAKDESDFSAPFFEISEAHVQLENVATAELNIKSKLTGKITNNSTLTLIGIPAKDIKQEDLAQIIQKQ